MRPASASGAATTNRSSAAWTPPGQNCGRITFVPTPTRRSGCSTQRRQPTAWSSSAVAATRSFDKYDPAGRVLWTRQFGTPGEDHANDVAVAPNGNIYVSGHLGAGFQQAADAFVRQYDGLGNEGWTQQFAEPGASNSARGLAVAPDETIFAMSVARLLGPFPPERPFFSAFDCFGTRLLSRPMNQVGINAAASAGSVFVAGQWPCIGFCPTTGRGTLSRYDRSGTELWTLDPGLYRPAGGVDVDDAGNAYVAGFSSVDRPQPDSAHRLIVLSYDPDGTERLRFRFDEPGGEYSASGGRRTVRGSVCRRRRICRISREGGFQLTRAPGLDSTSGREVRPIASTCPATALSR